MKLLKIPIYVKGKCKDSGDRTKKVCWGTERWGGMDGHVLMHKPFKEM